jgi:K(+)-stimulated pyrophosphate-energized sodium pump
VIKFTTLFGLLAVEIAVEMSLKYKANLRLDPNTMNWSPWVGGFFFLVALVFVYRSFYAMRIPEENTGTDNNLVLPHDHRH